MIKFRRKTDNDSSFFDLTPMLDVTFIMLVFFILTSNVAQHLYPVAVPTSDPSFKNQTIKPQSVKITIFNDGSFAIDSKKTRSIKEVKKSVIEARNSSENLHVLIVSDSTATVQDMMSLLTFCQGNGITNIDILVQQ